MKVLNIKLYVEEDDFCKSDLKEILQDGFNNVGNHTLKDFEVEEWKYKK